MCSHRDNKPSIKKENSLLYLLILIKFQICIAILAVVPVSAMCSASIIWCVYMIHIRMPITNSSTLH